MSRKFIDLTNRPKLYELRQHPHTISFCYVLVVHSKTWVCLLKDEKDASIIVKKEDATVKRSFNTKNLVYTPFVIFKFDIFNKILPSNFGFVNDISILCPIFLLHFMQIAFRIKWFSTFWIEQKSALKILSTSAPAPSDVKKFVEMILSIDDIKVWHWHLKTACPLKIKI